MRVLNAPVTFADFLNGEEIGLNLPKPRLWIFRRKELLNVVVQHGLVFFYWKNVVATLLHNLSREPFLGVQGVCGDHFS